MLRSLRRRVRPRTLLRPLRIKSIRSMASAAGQTTVHDTCDSRDSIWGHWIGTNFPGGHSHFGLAGDWDWLQRFDASTES